MLTALLYSLSFPCQPSASSWLWRTSPPTLTPHFTGKCLNPQKTHTLLTCCIRCLKALRDAVQVLSEATLLDNVAKKQECVKVLS